MFKFSIYFNKISLKYKNSRCVRCLNIKYSLKISKVTSYFVYITINAYKAYKAYFILISVNLRYCPPEKYNNIKYIKKSITALY